ncbi:hypothetical protein I601_4130 [Nocardioides dokdonensis FR1436]|uniref:Uncharacterized protein n=1 Tax=Nocardioides dokdonensis FR1436 TaxID=1300347 RepID=A0A1A9GSS6_9ACTN|nr:hypothetical protein [Nocardioides dokdonensis]ANH40525.1 hypothetical protein I601_4130 [Nocardioides dokdonensis FR1436]
MTVSGQFSCPPAGSFVAVSGQFLVAADMAVEEPTVLYSQDATYGADRQVRAGGEWAVVVNPTTRVLITVLFRDRDRWLAADGDTEGPVLRDVC